MPERTSVQHRTRTTSIQCHIPSCCLLLLVPKIAGSVLWVPQDPQVIPGTTDCKVTILGDEQTLCLDLTPRAVILSHAGHPRLQVPAWPGLPAARKHSLLCSTSNVYWCFQKSHITVLVWKEELWKAESQTTKAASKTLVSLTLIYHYISSPSLYLLQAPSNAPPLPPPLRYKTRVKWQIVSMWKAICLTEKPLHWERIIILVSIW